MFIHNLQSHWFTQDKYTMISSTSPFFLSLIILLLIANTSIQSLDRQQPFLRVACSYSKGNYTNSVYQTNLNLLLPSLHLSNGYGFYNDSFGENSDQVYAIGLCRGDLIADACSACLGNSTNILTQSCPNQMEATIWNENCMLRYSNRTLYGILEVLPAFYQSNSENVSSSSLVVDEFNQQLMTLLESLTNEASGGGSLRKYAVGNKSVTDSNRTMFGLAQCTPDLSTLDCNHCLKGGLEFISNSFYGKDSVRFVKPSCNLRYEAYLFFDPAIGSSGSLAPAPTSPPSGKKSTHTPWVIIIPIVATAEASVLVVSICMYLRAKKRTNGLTEEEITNADQITSAEALQFDVDSIRVATNNFSEANKLGRGGFGAVYKGRLASDEDIAVKRLSRDSAQGDLEFKNEVSLVAKLQHRNLVRLLGFCLEGNERLLVYEFVPNGSLDKFIFDAVKRANLNWDSRYKIIVGIGRGLLYLHEDSRLRIIHRDLKASNVLLDAEMNPKIADFGLARLFVLDQVQGETNRIVGTYGYMAPEYVMRGQFSVKSDVYSFGVLVLEIVTGQKNSSFHHEGNMEDLLSYVWKNWREETTSNIIDPTWIAGSRGEILRCIHIGLLCVQQNVADRPTMASVILMLTSNSLSLPEPSQPAFFMVRSDMTAVEGLDQYRSSFIQQSVNEVSITELSPR